MDNRAYEELTKKGWKNYMVEKTSETTLEITFSTDLEDTVIVDVDNDMILLKKEKDAYDSHTLDMLISMGRDILDVYR